MIKVLYFARLKESLKYSTEDMELLPEIKTVSDLMGYLSLRGEVWKELFSGNPKTRAAINHELVDKSALIKDGDEVAFFPPVTGG